MASHLQMVSKNNKIVKRLNLQDYLAITNTIILALIALKLFGVL